MVTPEPQLTACDVFIHDTKKDLDELFNRVRQVETAQAVHIERDNTLLEKMNELQEFFKNHDTNEMKKYITLELEVAKLTKLFYIATGVGLLLGFIGIDNMKLLIGG